MHLEQIIARAEMLSSKLDMIAVQIAEITTIVILVNVILNKVESVLETIPTPTMMDTLRK
jgi:hypothetical protein